MQQTWQQNLPMYATYSRILLAPVIVAVMHLPYSWSGQLAAVLFVIGSLTDWLDGYWARKYNAISAMGKFMDPIADKIIVLAALVMLLVSGRIDAIMLFLLLGRDLFIGGIRSVAAVNQVVIDAKAFGKYKTALQMISIPILLLPTDLVGEQFHHWAYVAMWISVALSIISGVQYTVGYLRGRTK